MKKNNPFIKQAALAVLVLAGSSAWLMAQDGATTPPSRQRTTTDTTGTTTTDTSAQPNKLNKASSLIGTAAKDQGGTEIAKIKDLVVDFNGDRVAYCVVDVNPGVLNAEKLHAAPLRDFQPSADGTTLTANVDKEKLANYQGF